MVLKLYENRDQHNICIDVEAFLENLLTKKGGSYILPDCMRSCLISGAKYAIRNSYELNKRQFTKEHKEQLLKIFSEIIDLQFIEMEMQTKLAH